MSRRRDVSFTLFSLGQKCRFSAEAIVVTRNSIWTRFIGIVYTFSNLFAVKLLKLEISYFWNYLSNETGKLLTKI